jgi:branched-chain amino acid transport system ATP-binding protein
VPEEPLLKLTDVHTFYGSIEALKGISLEVNKGEIVCLIGANGAGKSTTLMSISGIERPREGKIEFEGKRIDGASPDSIVKAGISQAPEGRRIFPQLSVMENLRMGSYVRDDQDEVQKDLEWVFRLFPVLKERRRQLGGTLSGGEQQMLAIARALMARPKLLLLDEPSLGLAPFLVETIFKTIEQINKEGTTVLLVEQNAHMALNLAHRGYVLETGTIALSGRAKDLLQDDKVRKAYLGE